MKSLFSVICFSFFFLLYSSVNAQKNVSISFENAKEECRDMPLDKRIRITVSRFSVGTPKATNEFGRNMSTMLSNALQEINCFDVLGSLKDNDELMDEIDFGNSDYSDTKNTAKKGKMLGAQVVVTGEITEYSHTTSSQGYGNWAVNVNTGKQKLKLGFIIQFRNPETRQILFSKSVNVTGAGSGGTLVRAGWFSSGNSSNNEAEADALEKGILKAVEIIVAEKSRIEREVHNKLTPINQHSLSKIIISNASYETLEDFSTILKKMPQVLHTDPSLEDGIAIFSVEHDGRTSKLLEEIRNKAGAKYKITGLKDGEIKILAK